jgi:hypothetical protein
VIKDLGPGPVGLAESAHLRQCGNAGLWLGANAAGPLRQLIPGLCCADDVGFYDDIGGAADHQQMLDIVAPDQHQPPAAVHGGGVDHGQTRHPAAIGAGAKAISGESAHQPSGDTDQRQNGHKRKEKCQCRHVLSPANSVFFKSLVSRTQNGTDTTDGEETSDWPQLLTSHGKSCRPAS